MRKYSSLVLAVSLSLACLLAAPLAADADEVVVTLLQTSDLHGNLQPWDYFTERAASRGLAKIATKVAEIRRQSPQALLLDAGDTIQGTPLAYLHARRDNAPPDPMMLAMNELGYDAMTVGNHEYNFGLAVLEKARREARFPWLSANTYETATRKNHFDPYIVKEVGGVRVGILGLTTRNIPNWETPANYAGLEFADTVAEAHKWVPVLRGKERCDLVVVLTHQGLERDLVTARENDSAYENQAWRLAHEVPGIDVLLMGHAHSDIPPTIVGNVILAEPKRWGEVLTRIDVRLARTGKDKWRVVDRRGENIRMDDSVPPDPRILELSKPYHERAQAYLASVVGQATGPFTAASPRSEDTALMDLLHKVQMKASGAQLSIASLLPSRPPEIPAGPITVRQLFAFYIYDNTLYSIRVTGKQVRAALEHAATYYDGASCGDGSGGMELRVGGKMRSYNYDTLAGADYRVDPTRPTGQRIVMLNWQERPMRDDEQFTLALNNYRHAGGGGYTMLKGAPVVWKTSTEIRELLLEYVREIGTIEPTTDFNWAIAPAWRVEYADSQH